MNTVTVFEGSKKIMNRKNHQSVYLDSITKQFLNSRNNGKIKLMKIMKV